MSAASVELELVELLHKLAGVYIPPNVVNKLVAIVNFIKKVLDDQLAKVINEGRTRAEIQSWILDRLAALIGKFEGANNRTIVSHPAIVIALDMVIMFASQCDSIDQAHDSIEGCKTMVFLKSDSIYGEATSELLRLIEKVLEYTTENEFPEFVEVVHRVHSIRTSL